MQTKRLAAPSHGSRGARPSVGRRVAYLLPGRVIRIVVVRRPFQPRVRKPGQRKPLPRVEAFFTTDLTLSLEAILAQYRERWAVEITSRDSNAFAGFGQDQCRKHE